MPLAAACRIALAASCSCLRRLGEIGPLLLARQLLEPARRFLGFLRELPLAAAAAAAARLLLLLRPACARRRCRSASCCCRRASSFSFSAS